METNHDPTMQVQARASLVIALHPVQSVDTLPSVVVLRDDVRQLVEQPRIRLGSLGDKLRMSRVKAVNDSLGRRISVKHIPHAEQDAALFAKLLALVVVVLLGQADEF